LESEKWFPKLEIDVVKPWNQIEHDLYRVALLANRELAEKAKNEGVSQDCDNDLLINWVRSSIRPVREPICNVSRNPTKSWHLFA